jgi:hypothetical protein
MKPITKFIAGLLVAGAATTAQAWGEREQGILTGIAGVWLFNQLTRPEPQPQYIPPPPVVYQSAPVYVYPSPPVYAHRPRCHYVPAIDQFGRVMYYRQHCH